MSQENQTQTGGPILFQMFLRHGVVVALVLGLVARIVLTTALVPWDEVPTHWDDASYAKYAIETLQLGRLNTHHFPVGYPLFVALCLKIGGGSFAAVRIANVLLGLVTIVTVSKISNLCFGRLTGIVAAWLTALYPPLVFMTSRVLSETLFIALLTTSLYWYLLNAKAATMTRSALAGAFFALGSLVRSNLLLMLPFIPIWQLWPLRTVALARLKVVVFGMAIAGSLLAVPGFYFLATKGEYLPLATNAGQTLYGANNPLADGNWIQVEEHQELLESIPAEVRRSPQAYSKAQNQLAIRWIRQNPGAFMRLLPRKFANAWIPGLQKSVTTSKSKGTGALFAFCFAALIICAIVGRAKTRPAVRDGILLAVLVAYTLLSLIFYGNPRIGLFCAPVLIVYASAWLASLLGKVLAPNR